ncbi:MAG: glutathione S-transferase, partial [Cucumibacter sp.]
IEYFADRFPDKGVWPRDFKDRAIARALSAEVHGGFNDLRNAAPMNLRASHPNRIDLGAVGGDLKRFEAIVAERIKASGGPFLFGKFSAADAMYAPLATRLETYVLPVSRTTHAYMEAVFALPAFREWKAAAMQEPWIVDMDEIDVIQGKRAAKE